MLGRLFLFVLSSALATGLAKAQNLSYGADNFYRSQLVEVSPITFHDQYRHHIAGNSFIRRDLSHSANASLPAIVIGHPMGAVKEQSANLYAMKLAEQGFVTVTLDLPFWGASEGEPRNAVSAELYAEAYSAAVDFLGGQELVDRQRIGALGVCGSGSFVISAAKIDQRIKAIATSSMYDMGAVSRNGLQRSQSVEQRKALIATASEQRWRERDGGQPQYPFGTVDRLTPNSTAVEREFYDFYRTKRGEFTPRGTTANLTTHRTLPFESKFLNFYPFNDIETISPRPLFFIAGDQAHSREFSEDAYSRAAEPKHLHWVPGAGHVDLYDRVELIPFAKLAEFFHTHLVNNGTAV